MNYGTRINSLIIFLIQKLRPHEPVTKWQSTKIGPKKYKDPTITCKEIYAYALIFIW